MPKGLRRIHGGGDWHFITCSCYRRRQFFRPIRRRDFFLKVLEQLRIKDDFIVAGYVVMPEHIHLLISEPKSGEVTIPTLHPEAEKQEPASL
jgi:putative transposase